MGAGLLVHDAVSQVDVLGTLDPEANPLKGFRPYEGVVLQAPLPLPGIYITVPWPHEKLPLLDKPLGRGLYLAFMALKLASDGVGVQERDNRGLRQVIEDGGETRSEEHTFELQP